MKIATIQRIDGKEYARIPKVLGVKFDAKTMFGSYEVSNKLNDALMNINWVDITTLDPDDLENIVNHGYDFAGTHYISIFSFWRDMKGKAIMVPEGTMIEVKYHETEDASDIVKTGVRTEVLTQISQLGMNTNMKKLDDAMKAGKYINRHMAPLQIGEEYVKGVVSEVGEPDANGNFEVVYELSKGDWIVVRYNNLKTMDDDALSSCDGALDCSPRFVEIMAKYNTNVKHGQSWTIASKFGMGKGHSRIIPGLEPDLVINGSKTVYEIEGIEFGIRTDLHPGSPHTDEISNFNFQFDREFMMPKLVKAYLKYVFESAHNELAFKKVFLGNATLPDEMFATKEELIQRAYDQETTWSVQRYMQRGASIFCMPWLYRKVVNHLMTKVLQARDGRVPMEFAPGKGVAISRYSMGDIYTVMPDGSIDMSKSIIPDGFCVCMDLPAGIKLAVYRQPNENQNAFVILTNMHHPAYEFARGGVYVYEGVGISRRSKRLGGRDNDDALIIIHDSEWVRGFEELNAIPYPEWGPLVTDEEQEEKDKEAFFMGTEEDVDRMDFYDELMGVAGMEGYDITQYSSRHAIHQIERARTSGAGIGPVSNAILLDTGVSIPRYKAYIARWLDSNKMMEELDTLANKEDYQMRKLATYLEKVIDAAVKDRSELEGLGDVTKQVRDFHDNARFYPSCLEHKIPAKKKDKSDFILVETPMCRALARIQDDIDMLTEAFKTNEWLLVRAADREVLMAYPSNEETRRIVHGEPRTAGKEPEDLEPGLLTIWRREWANHFSEYRSEAESKLARVRIVNMIMDFVKPYEFMMNEIAVELYRTYYKGKKAQAAKDTTGMRRHYSDGLLGINYFANHLLDALEEIGFTGETYKVDFAKYSSFMSKVSLNVKVNKGIVYRAKDMKAVGNCARCPDGEYEMIAGLITAREAHACLQAPDNMFDLPMDMEVASLME